MEWQIEELEECASTFDAARLRPAWWVVSAVRQRQGRGRFNRTWFGEPGGLWASYNVPLNPALPVQWGLLPLVAGVAIMRALAPHRIEHLRLRWPNDVLVGRSKLAGILVERPATHLASIGIGLNILNDVQSISALVQDPPARLADLICPCPGVAEVRAALAEALYAAYSEFVRGGLAALEAELAAAWQGERAVEVQTDGGSHFGLFAGVEADGSPILRREDGACYSVPGIAVNRLRELCSAPGSRS